MRTWFLLVGAALGMSALTPAAAVAQSATSGAIAGVVRDTTGAVLPGVSVEAASPALIEKVRVVVTDSQGQYKIIDLRPGTYSVSFTLAGFATVRREGLELSTGFTAPADATMKVGGLEETVLVSGASPVIDVQNARAQSVLTREILDQVPTAKNVPGFASLTLGAVSSVSGAVGADVGGSKGENASMFGIHGTSGLDMKLTVDGMNMSALFSTGGALMRLAKPNDALAQEVVLETGGMSAESETGGVQMNIVPKEGSNALKVTAFGNYTNEHMQADNISSPILARGLTVVPSVKRIYDASVGVGGPIKRDTLWFFGSFHSWASSEYQAGSFYNASPNPLFYVADTTRPGFQDFWNKDGSVRLTWQAGPKHKFSFSESLQDNCYCYFNAFASAITASPESTINFGVRPTITQGTWTYTATNRLLITAGATLGTNPLDAEAVPETVPGAISILEASTVVAYGSRGSFGRIGTQQYRAPGGVYNTQANQRFAVSYVTGSHAFKTGMTMLEGWTGENVYVNSALTYTFFNQRPLSLTEWPSPSSNYANIMPNLGIYGQDQWTLNRLTLNLGLRFDYFNAYTPDFQYPGSRFVPAFDAPAVHDVPNWKDVSPRFGAAYDVFGNGKTALKGYAGRYLGSMGIGLAQANHPFLRISPSATRTWTDTNGNFAPDCDLSSVTANGECGTLSDRRFGQAVSVTSYGSDVLTGFGARPYNWQGSIAVQQELRPGFALNVGYYRTAHGNFTVTNNQAVASGNFTPYCVTVPVDARLPGGGGNQICGLYDINPAQFGLVNNEITQTSNFGSQTQVFNGVDVAVSAKFGKGGLLNGGVSIGRTVTDNCYQNDKPQLLTQGAAATTPRAQAFCHVSPPWLAGSQVKINGVYPLPWDIQASAVFQNLPGGADAAQVRFTNAQIAPSLGRNLSAGAAGTVLVDVIPPQSVFEDRLTQLDLRFAKTLRVRRVRLQANFDVYNVLNASTIVSVNGTYGPSWLKPTGILGGRLFKVGGQVDF